MKFSLPDVWSLRLFLAVCRKHGVHPYRYHRQRRTTVMVRVQERAFDRLVWAEFSRLQSALEIHFEETVDHLINGDAFRWRRPYPGGGPDRPLNRGAGTARDPAEQDHRRAGLT